MNANRFYLRWPRSVRWQDGRAEAEYAFHCLWTSSKLEDVELAAGPASMEISTEARIARLEADVAHLRSDVAEIKVDLRARFDKVEARMDRLDAKVDAVKDRLASAKVWALFLYFALAGSMLGVMARGFGWI